MLPGCRGVKQDRTGVAGDVVAKRRGLPPRGLLPLDQGFAATRFTATAGKMTTRRRGA